MPRLYFAGWDRPLLRAATDHLTSGWNRGALDLSRLLIIVPSAESGRMLRESLARRAAEEDQAVLSPQLITPEQLIDFGLHEMPQVASPADVLLAWMQALQSMDAETLSPVFPVAPVTRDEAWAQQTAAALLKVRSLLEEGGRSVTEAAEALGEAHQEAVRWSAFAAIEQAAQVFLQKAGLTDRLGARLQAARQPVLPRGIKSVLVAGVPDPMELVIIALQTHERQGIPVDVMVSAPPEEARSFDAWGRPVTYEWTERPILIPDAAARICLLARPDDEAAALLDHFRASNAAISLGSADPAVAGPLVSMAASAGIPVFNPAGIPLSSHELLWLLTCLRDLLRSDSQHTAGLLLRIPEVLRAALPNISAITGLRAWDEFTRKSMPRTLTDAALIIARQPAKFGTDGEPVPDAAAAAVTWLRESAGAISSAVNNESLTRWLEKLFEGRTFDSPAGRKAFLKAISLWQQAAESVDLAAARAGSRLSAAARLDFALHLLRDARLFPDNESGMQEISGWLELPWQDAAELVIAGMNEGMVPSSVTSDPWLPDSTRAGLQLRTNATRLARDSFLLTVMLENRRASGRVTLIAARETATGEPLKPSRLLLRCLEPELPQRALQLFPEVVPAGDSRPTPAWFRAWPLVVPAPPAESRAFKTLSVTQFTDYLRCPFRFYLKHVLRMEPYVANPDEMDARGFGNLIHDAMQALHTDPDLNDSSDAEKLTDFLHHQAGELMHSRHGHALTVPLLIQLESARNRLRSIAGVQAQERAAGWRVYQVEVTFPDLPGSNQKVTIDGMEIRGRIDLIETHPVHGLRVLDYKTAANPKKPRDHHLEKASAETPAWQTMDDQGKAVAWSNLQLPLYAWIVGKISTGPVTVCYFNAPKALTKTEILTWEITAEEIRSAVHCATNVVQCIRQCRFWPPSKVDRKMDDFRDLWFDNIEDSFDPAIIEKHRELQVEEQLRTRSTRP